MGAGQARCCIPLPSQLPDLCRIPLALEGADGDGWKEGCEEFAFYIAHRAVEDAYMWWNRRWEGLLVARGVAQDQQIGKAMQGRGGAHKEVWKLPQKSRAKTTLTMQAAKLRHLVGILYECQHQLRKEGQIPGHLLQALGRRWQAVHHALLPDEADQQEWIVEALAQAREQLTQEQTRAGQQKRATWKHAISTFTGDAMAKAAWFVTQKTMRPLQFVLGQGGRPLTTWWDQDMELQNAWRAVHNLPEGCDEPQIARDDERVYGHLLPASTAQQWGCPDAELLRRAASRHKSRTAAGACGWRKQELMWLPKQAWKELAALLALSEELASLPDNMCQVWVSLIPKPAAQGPMDLRPIGVTGLLYRTWAKAKKHQMDTWYAAQMSGSHYGAVAGRSAEQVLGWLSMTAERAQLDTGEPMFAIKMDFSKFFDTIPWSALEVIMARLGADENFLATYMYHLRHNQCRYKLPHRSLGTVWCRQRGLTQGCPLSPACSNLLTLPFVLDLYQSLEAAGMADKAQAYLFLDDFTVVGSQAEVVEIAWQCAQRFADTLRLCIHVRRDCPAKTGVVVANQWEHEAWTEAQTLPVGTSLEALGKQVAMQGQQVEDPESGMAEVKQRATRIAMLPLPSEHRAMLMTSLAASKIAYARLGSPPTRQQVESLTHKLFCAAMGRAALPHGCSKEIFQVLWMAAHRTHPYFIQIHGLGRLLHYCLQERRQFTLSTWALALEAQRRGTPKPGLISDFLVAWSRIQGSSPVEGRLCFPGWPDLEVADTDTCASFLHELRDRCRSALLTPLVSRRPDFAGIQYGIDRVRTLKWWRTQTGYQRHMSRYIFIGGIQTSERTARHAKRLVPPCPWCSSVGGETWEHAAWHCPAWVAQRHISWQQASTWPKCLSLHGLFPCRQALAIDDDCLARLQAQLTAIACSLMDRHKANGGLAQYASGPPLPRAIPEQPVEQEGEVFHDHHLRHVREAQTMKYLCLRCGRCAIRKHRFQTPCTGRRAGNCKLELPDAMQEIEVVNGNKRIQCCLCMKSCSSVHRSRFIRKHCCR